MKWECKRRIRKRGKRGEGEEGLTVMGDRERGKGSGENNLRGDDEGEVGLKGRGERGWSTSEGGD